MDHDTEAYILLLLSDSNLPTGAFVASAGLESYVAHGFFSLPTGSSQVSSQARVLNSTSSFVRDSLSSYARAALPFVADAHNAAERAIAGAEKHDKNQLEIALQNLVDLDDLYERMTLNHVARRASQSQGVALLTLYARGFSPPNLPGFQIAASLEGTGTLGATKIVDQLKLMVRREDTHGHLPICWGVLTAALGLSTARSQYLHLFLQARSLLSASVRLNTIGPYAAQQLLLHAVRPMVERGIADHGHLHTGISTLSHQKRGTKPPSQAIDETIAGPTTTWPLGEILATRHDLQHSRIFNS